MLDCVVVGAGPAGLMAAEVLVAGGAQVDVFDAMPSVGRKFLLAGKGGLNLTHSEPLEPFLSRYEPARASLEPMLRAFGPEALREWAAGLGVQTFVGTSGRVFPTEMKAAPLLRAWLHRLRQAGARFHARHRWTGWTDDGALRFESPQGEQVVQSRAVLLALGGASWPQLGSNGAWAGLLAARGVALAPLMPANCGFDVGWSEHLRSQFAGQPVKPVVLSFSGHDGAQFKRQGEFVLTDTGIEGSLVYAASALLRDEIAAQGSAAIELDLLPARDAASVLAEVSHPRGSRSLSSHLKSRLNLQGLKMALLHEVLDKAAMNDPVRLAAAIKALPLRLTAARPIAEAISTAGGVRFDAMDEGLMLKALPGTFCMGEMLDWEAPTGGYLLTASMSSGRVAAAAALRWRGAVAAPAA